MPPIISTILDQEIGMATPTSTDWFLNCQFLAFQANQQEYLATSEFVIVAVALFAQLNPGGIGTIERNIKQFQRTIDNINLIQLPAQFRNDCFPMRLQINPSAGFYARIFAISC